MIETLIAELEQCLAKVDETGQKLAGAYLSSAIDALKLSIYDRQVPRAAAQGPHGCNSNGYWLN